MGLRLITKSYKVLCISFSLINVVILEKCNTLSGLPWEEGNAYNSLIKHNGFTINVETKTKVPIFIPDWEVILWLLGFQISCHMTIN